MELMKYILILLISTVTLGSCADLSDDTASVFPGASPNNVSICAYGDYNADKLVDIFVTQAAKVIKVFLAQENKAAYIPQTLLNLTSNEGFITSVMPADFNGDALMDLLVTTQNSADALIGEVNIYVSFGTDDNYVQKMGPLGKIATAKDEPTLYDLNQDMLPDLLFEKTDGELVIFLSSTNGSFTPADKPFGDETPPKLLLPQSNAFVDLTQDYMANLFLTTEGGYQVWINHEEKLARNVTIPLPPRQKEGWKLGQASFQDIDQDGFPDLLVPMCRLEGGECKESEVYGHSFADPDSSQWVKVLTHSVAFGDSKFNFYFTDSAKFGLPALPMTLRLGDYNSDGYPDALVFVKTLGKDEKHAMLLQNVACEGHDNCFLNRTFKFDANHVLMSTRGAVLGSFFDLYEDGILDILLVTITENQLFSSYPVLRSLSQTSTTDTCFMKVTVTSGLCYKNCLDDRQPYGVNVPGPVVKFKTTSVTGVKQASSSTQLSQSSHLALQLPFVFFGLGQTPNFVDNVGVGIPVLNKRGAVEERDWTQIIPNSQLVVIPYPKNAPDRWILKLFVTPSKAVYITGASLLGTMGFVAGIVGILHWKERREDMKEKRQESHKFHFDAM